LKIGLRSIPARLKPYRSAPSPSKINRAAFLALP
jgi:hypothetical protein